MGIMGRLRGAEPSDLTETGGSDGLADTVALLEADIAQLERQLTEPGWQRIDTNLDEEFTRDGLTRISRLCRYYQLKNPLIRRASAVKTAYVWGQGVEVSADDPDVNLTVRDLMDDRQNRAALFGAAARDAKEKALHTDGNVFLACWSHPRTGRVQVRSVQFSEVHDIICSPDDVTEPWYYLRRSWQTFHDPVTGNPKTELVEQLHPDIDYRPTNRPGTWGRFPVMWDAPILHIHINRPDGWKFGVPELYPALDWARAHAEYLDDFRRLVKVMAKLAWKLNVKGSQLARARQKMAEVTAESAPVGQAWIGDHGASLEAIRTPGVTLSPQDSRQFALMVSAATDIPETMLLGDPSTGNLATAQTLDRPTELAMESRRRVWTAAYRRLAEHAIDQSVTAPGGTLSGLVERDEYDRQVVTLAGDAPRAVSVDWPPLEERSQGEIIQALVGSTGGAVDVPGMPAEVLLRAALVAMEVDDPDRLVEDAMAALEQEGPEPGELGEVLRELREAIAS